MKLEIPAFEDGGAIPEEHCFCRPAADGRAEFGANRNPEVRWSGAPEDTRSLALIVHDPDVPSAADAVNREGLTVPADLPRVDFFHWVLVDIPPSISGIAAGADSDAVTRRGKAPRQGAVGVSGRNDYTGWFAGDDEMAGVYGGYDGPCPPWNDELVHRYCFTLYALDLPSLDLGPTFGGLEALQAMTGHILAKVEHVGTYSLRTELTGQGPG